MKRLPDNWIGRIDELKKEITLQHEAGRVRWRMQAAVALIGIAGSKLRFWEEHFNFVVTRHTGQEIRYYTFENMLLILEIIRLLEVEGYTIQGARRQLLNSSFSNQIKK